MTYFSYLPEKLQEELQQTAEAIVCRGKGILAVDETNGNLKKHNAFLLTFIS